MSGGLIDVATISALLNGRAETYAPLLLPNGVKDGHHWKTSSIDDVKTGGYSLVVDLSGPNIGRWRDFGGCKPGEERGDILDLIRLRRCGGDMKAAIEWAKTDLGLVDGDRTAHERARRETARQADARAAQHEEEKTRKRGAARALWLHAVALSHAEGRPGVAYLRRRAIDLVALGKAPGALRYRPDVYNREAQRKLPCLLAAIVGLNGQHLGTHRTWLQMDAEGWTKARLAEAKRTLGPSLGGHIPLWKGTQPCKLGDIRAGTPIWVSEGIEDGLSVAMARPTERVIAAVSLSKIGALELPDPDGPNRPGPIIIIGQRDPYGSKAVDALERGIGQLQRRGYEVQIVYPPAPWKDFNEWLMRDPRGALGHDFRKAG